MNVQSDLQQVVGTVRASTLAGHVGLFEAFLQCWVLNYLLSRLEKLELWTNEERMLATKLSPVHGDTSPAQLAMILRSLPIVRRDLAMRSPHRSDPLDAFEHGVKSEPSLLEAMSLFVGVRNLVVHRGGWMSTAFAEKHQATWQAVHRDDAQIPDLVGGQVLRIQHESVRIAAAALYRACLAMTQVLIRESGERRGHLNSPGPPLDEALDRSTPIVLPPLLMPGDHETSYRWQADQNFREALLAEAALFE